LEENTKTKRCEKIKKIKENEILRNVKKISKQEKVKLEKGKKTLEVENCLKSNV